MKQIFTLLCSRIHYFELEYFFRNNGWTANRKSPALKALTLIFLSGILFSTSAFSQCNYTVGADGVSQGLTSPISIDGNMNDWAPYINDPDNNSYDNTLGIDLDGIISDKGRDLARFTFTEDVNYLYMNIARAGSVNNAVDIIYYADINDNGIMEANEPVIHFNWGGSNGSVTASICNYTPSITSILNSILLNLDGKALFGTLNYRNSGAGIIAMGSADGKSMEARIPYSLLTTINASGNVLNKLTAGKDFKFHVSTINGNISSIPNLNSINDNFGGCLRVAPAPFSTLPIKLLSFSALLNNGKADLKWAVTDNESSKQFELEKSTDGKNFVSSAVIFSTTKEGSENYSYKESSMLQDVSYYRLKIVGQDNTVSYSRIIRLSADKNAIGNQITLLENPVGPSLQFSYTSRSSQSSTVNVYNITGVKLVTTQIQLQKGVNSFQLDLNSKISTGSYLLEVTTNSERVISKFIKQ